MLVSLLAFVGAILYMYILDHTISMCIIESKMTLKSYKLRCCPCSFQMTCLPFPSLHHQKPSLDANENIHIHCFSIWVFLLYMNKGHYGRCAFGKPRDATWHWSSYNTLSGKRVLVFDQQCCMCGTNHLVKEFIFMVGFMMGCVPIIPTMFWDLKIRASLGQIIITWK